MLYYIILNGSQFGPYAVEDMMRMRGAGFISSQTLVWNENLSDWKAFGEVFPENPTPQKEEDEGLSERRNLPDREPQLRAGIPGWALFFFLIIGLGILAAGITALMVLRDVSAQLVHVESAVNRYFSDKEKEMDKVVKVDLIHDRTKVETVVEFEYRFELWSRDKAELAGKGGKLNMEGWEYVGPLCNNGLNAQYVLFRRPAGSVKSLR